ncbi:MAG: SusD/RagB family nutrient-binding outer membrane lipoprotein [Bacteroidales bacterium]|nr:SusD/RagB family nutrient-binding outer membrane lipoprotein [Bacteroidales bacterium]
MRRVLIYSLITLAVLFTGSCSKFEDLNTDPDNTSKVTPQLLATNLILQTAKYPSVGKDFLYKDMFAKYISYMEGSTGYQYNKIDRTYFSPLVKLTNVEEMIQAAKGSVTEDSYVALGHFLRAYTFFNLTLSVGDIPYSEALQGESGLYNPKYDTQKDVFLGILSELETASEMFGSARDFDGDPIYKGKVAKWQKATNVLELKVLSHLLKKTDDPDLRVAERFNSIVNSNKLFQSSNDNFQLVYSNVQVEYYPFFNSNFRKYPIMSTTIVDKMKELGDYRLFYFADPANAQLGAGYVASDWEAYVGVDPSDNYNDISSDYTAKKISGINSRYYMLEQGEPTFLLSYAEQCFIIAEGILRGWTNGDAKTFYDQGVQAALQFTAYYTPDNSSYHHGRKITTDVINTYLSADGVAFSGTLEEKLQKIFQQRYFMGFMQDGWNTYYEYRRTGYPAMPINESTNQNSDKTKMPVRWMYPEKELSYNRANVEEAINRQFNGNDDVNELMWILK